MRKMPGLSTVVVLGALAGAACSRGTAPAPATGIANTPAPAAAKSAAPAAPAATPAARKEVLVAVAGATGHGKSTLLAAIAKGLAEPVDGRRRSYQELKLGGRVEVGFEAGGRTVTLREYPSHAEAVRALADRQSGLAGFVLVVEQPAAIVKETREQIQAAGQAGLRPLVLVQTKDDLVDDVELKDLEQDEIEQALVQAKLLGEKEGGTWEAGKFKPGTALACVRLSARRALEGDARSREAVARLIALIEKQAAAR